MPLPLLGVLELALLFAGILWLGRKFENRHRHGLRRRHPDWFVDEEDTA